MTMMLIGGGGGGGGDNNVESVWERETFGDLKSQDYLFCSIPHPHINPPLPQYTQLAQSSQYHNMGVAKDTLHIVLHKLQMDKSP